MCLGAGVGMIFGVGAGRVVVGQAGIVVGVSGTEVVVKVEMGVVVVAVFVVAGHG